MSMSSLLKVYIVQLIDEKIVHQDIKTWNVPWKLYMRLEVKNHPDQPSGPSSWVFH